MSRYATAVKPNNTVKTGEPKFVGIDYAKKFSYMTVGDKDGNVLRQEPVRNDLAMLEQFFEPYPKLTVAIEACRGL